MKRLCLVLASSIGFAAFAAQADLQASACVKRPDLVRYLSKEFKEVPIARGLADSGAVFEVFSHRDGATWTIVVTMPSGATCLVATGNYWEELTRIIELGPST